MVITQFLCRVARERRPESTAAIHDDFGGRVGILLLQITFQYSLAKMHGFSGVFLLPFMVFADVE